MTTLQSPRSSIDPLPVLMMAAVLVGLMMLSSLPRVPAGMPTSTAVDLPALGAHALLHSDAKMAWDWVRQKGVFCKWDCRDGRDRYVCPMRGGRFAVVVADAVRVVTAFTTNQSYAKDVTDDPRCSNPWRLKHP